MTVPLLVEQAGGTASLLQETQEKRQDESCLAGLKCYLFHFRVFTIFKATQMPFRNESFSVCLSCRLNTGEI